MATGDDSDLGRCCVSKECSLDALQECLQEAKELFDLASLYQGDVTRSLGDQSVLLGNSAEQYRWFLYPQEAQSWLRGTAAAPPPAPPFTPKYYNPPSPPCPSVWDSTVQPDNEQAGGQMTDQRQTADQQQERKQTADQQQERKQTADQRQERKQTADQRQERKQTADQRQERKQTADQQQERKQTADQQQERKQTADQRQERKQTADQQPKRKQTADQQPKRKQTADQQQKRKQTADQRQERKQTADQRQERKQTADQRQESGQPTVLAEDNSPAEMHRDQTQSHLHIAMATGSATARFHCPPKCILKPTMEVGLFVHLTYLHGLDSTPSPRPLRSTR